VTFSDASSTRTTMNVYVHELDDGLGGADALDGLWGHPGATEHPQPAANEPVLEDTETGP
jgi:hypothetical protein